MSNATVIVTFSDDFKLYSQYQGTSDSFYPALFDSMEEAWDCNRRTEDGYQKLLRYENLITPERAHVYNDYGCGSDDYIAFACRQAKQLRVFEPWNDYSGDVGKRSETEEQWIKRILSGAIHGECDLMVMRKQ